MASRKLWVLVFLVVLLGTGLRTYGLNRESLEDNEIYTINIATLPASGIISLMDKQDIHPPLYELLLHYWISIFGTGKTATRYLSVLFGVASIILVFLLAKSLFNDEIGLISALLFAVSPINVYYSQESRSYALLVLLSISSFYFYLKFSKSVNNAKFFNNYWYEIFTILMLYTHYHAIFVLLSQNAHFLIINFGNWNNLKKWIRMQSIIIIGFIPQIYIIFSQMNRPFYIEFLTLRSALDSIYYLIGENWLILLIFMLLLLIYVTICLRNKKDLLSNYFSVTLLFCWLIIPIFLQLFLTLFFFEFVHNLFLYRYIITCSVAFSILLTFLIVAIIKRRIVRNIVLLIVFILLFSTVIIENNVLVKDDLEGVTRYFASNNFGKPILVLTPTYNNLGYYLECDLYSPLYSNYTKCLSKQFYYDARAPLNITAVLKEIEHDGTYADSFFVLTYANNKYLENITTLADITNTTHFIGFNVIALTLKDRNTTIPLNLFPGKQ